MPWNLIKFKNYEFLISTTKQNEFEDGMNKIQKHLHNEQRKAAFRIMFTFLFIHETQSNHEVLSDLFCFYFYESRQRFQI